MRRRGGLEQAAKKALQAVAAAQAWPAIVAAKPSGKFILWQVVTISLDGRIIDS